MLSRPGDCNFKLENSSLREGKEEADVRFATSNSKVDELQDRIAEMEFSSTKALSQIEFLQKHQEAVMKRENDLEQRLAQLSDSFAWQLAKAKVEAIAEFKRSEFFEENMILMQGSAMQMDQTKAIDVCSEVFPQLDKKDSRLTQLYSSSVELDFEMQFEEFKNGADLRDAEE